MGACLCKEEVDADEVSDVTREPQHNVSSPDSLDHYVSARSGSIRWKHPAPSTVDKLILETLNVVGTLVEKWVAFCFVR